MMNRLLLWCLAISLTIILSGCQPDTATKPTDSAVTTNPGAGKKIVVFVDQVAKDGTSLVKVEVKSTFDESAPQTALNALLSQPDTKDSYNLLAKANVKLLSLNIKNDLAIVNFSKEILSIKGGSMQELLLVGSIVNTLTEFKEIKKVQILVDGKRVETLMGHMDLSEPLEHDDSIMYKQTK